MSSITIISPNSAEWEELCFMTSDLDRSRERGGLILRVCTTSEEDLDTVLKWRDAVLKKQTGDVVVTSIYGGQSSGAGYLTTIFQVHAPGLVYQEELCMKVVCDLLANCGKVLQWTPQVPE